ncbi:hypothetical protein LJ737_04355 [Hymenobacter sp. 15J16-1T3B]|uniref:hypothetical protein n=1 Tax=Hymenobacter sp. 15J16-1T3B TaxID=2886941 RepID=UPI001D0F6D34|nr:hypothetical protein [Hymenobacter sp. 15J16-1T3B]MCC3156455.1 hypothetical protein [Hymenobacter sp. 15J16-1T3B]
MNISTYTRRARVAGTIALLEAVAALATRFTADGQLFKFKGKQAINRMRAEADQLVLQMDRLQEGEPMHGTNELLFLGQDFTAAALLFALLDLPSRTDNANVLRRGYAQLLEGLGDEGAVARMEADIERLMEARGLPYHPDAAAAPAEAQTAEEVLRGLLTAQAAGHGVQLSAGEVSLLTRHLHYQGLLTRALRNSIPSFTQPAQTGEAA